MGYEREQQAAYQLSWSQQRRIAWVESQGGKCVACGSIDSLEVDHVDRSTKMMQPAHIWTRALHVREAELAKCQVLCHSCHLAKTLSEVKRDETHGRTTMYRKGCRCEDCRAAHREGARKTRNAAEWVAAK